MRDAPLIREALGILARAPDAPPDPGDELRPLTEAERRAFRAVGLDSDPFRMSGEPIPAPKAPDPDLPGLDRVRAAARSDLPELVLAGFLATPQPDLETGRGVVTPADWLWSGRNPEAVVALARGL